MTTTPEKIISISFTVKNDGSGIVHSEAKTTANRIITPVTDQIWKSFFTPPTTPATPPSPNPQNLNQ